MVSRIVISFIIFFLLTGCNKKEKYYYPNGSIQTEIEYTNSQNDGFIVQYYPNGNRKNNGFLKEGLIHDTFYEYYDDGKSIMEKGYYYKSTAEGKHEEYYLSGQIKEICNYSNGKPNGERIRYYESGKLKSKETFENGVFSGDYSHYDENGNIDVIAIIESDSVVLFRQKFSETGILIDEYRKVSVESKSDTVKLGDSICANIKIFGPRENHDVEVQIDLLPDPAQSMSFNDQWEIEYKSYPIQDTVPHLLLVRAIVDTSRYGTDKLIFVKK